MHNKVLAFGVLVLALLGGRPAHAGTPPAPAALSALPRGGEGVVAEVREDLTLRLTDGTVVRLALLLPPRPPLGQKTWPPLGKARALLAALVQGKAVTLHWPEPQWDRHGRRVAHVLRANDGLWVQEALVAAGLVQVLTFADERAAAAALLHAEDDARTARRGLWTDPAFGVHDAGTAARTVGTFRIIEGTVLDTAEVRGRIYLNFGADWRTDFTVLIPPQAVKRFDTDPLALAGRRIRVRGWVQDYNGPLIEVTHPEAVELLPAENPPGNGTD